MRQNRNILAIKESVVYFNLESINNSSCSLQTRCKKKLEGIVWEIAMERVHIKKLCVGCFSRVELARWQRAKMRWAKENGMGENKVWHDTRALPKLANRIKVGGSLYWIIRGAFSARQTITDFSAIRDERGIKLCRIWLAPKLIPTVALRHRPFQGWRYLMEQDAPKDIYDEHATRELDEERELNEMLVELGLV